MAVRIVYSEIAKNDLRAIFNFIKKGSLKYALIEVSNIRVFIGKLKTRPQIGKQFEDAGDESIREVIYKNYRIIYEMPTEEKIGILTIHHHARSLTNNPALTEEE